jgi:ABC-type sugar transport system permease subunit
VSAKATVGAGAHDVRRLGLISGTMSRRRRSAALVLISPATVLVTVVIGVALVQSLYYSMTDWDGVTTVWRGPSTYLAEVRNPIFWRVLENNMLLILAILVGSLLGLIVAYAVDQHVMGWRIFRIIYLLPASLSWVVLGMIAVRFFAARGALNGALSHLGFGSTPTDLLSGQHSAMLAVGLAFIWPMVGVNMIVYLTGLSTLDSSLTDAASLDGAGLWQKLRWVIAPQLRRFVVFDLLINLVYSFTALFGLIFVMTGGGPGYGSTTLEFLVYQQAFSTGRFGEGAMLGVILVLLMCVICGPLALLLRED